MQAFGIDADSSAAANALAEAMISSFPRRATTPLCSRLEPPLWTACASWRQQKSWSAREIG
jgi:hypothetical protein